MKSTEKELLQNLFKTTYDWLNYGDDNSYKKYTFSDDVNDSQNNCVSQINSTNFESSQNDSSLTEKLSTLSNIYQEIRNCTKCPLCSYRKNTVPGMGVDNPLVLVIGEGPGQDEDEQGLPFVGKAGQLLDKMLNSISLNRKVNCYIANIVKCRPPQNRVPLLEESQNCFPYLQQQIKILQPKIILALGRTAVQNLLNTSDGINSLRGKVFKYNNIPLIATFHPSALLREEELKRPAWEDLKQLRQLLLKIDPNYDKVSKT